MMSYSTKEDNSSTQPIFKRQLMGFAKNGNLFIENCLKELSWHYSGVYGKVAECLSDLKSGPNQDAETVFNDRDSNDAGN